jgi:putative holliday junction resolvase
MRYLAIDHGLKRTGLAICDASEMMTSPLCVLHGQRDIASKIAQILVKEEVEAVVVGLPLNMDGSEGIQAQKVRQFAGQLSRQVKVPIYLHDERLSSFGAQEKLGAMDLTEGRRRDLLDAVAAAEILQSFLDAKTGGEGPT